jgi:hypothetical protein
MSERHKEIVYIFIPVIACFLSFRSVSGFAAEAMNESPYPGLYVKEFSEKYQAGAFADAYETLPSTSVLKTQLDAPTFNSLIFLKAFLALTEKSDPATARDLLASMDYSGWTPEIQHAVGWLTFYGLGISPDIEVGLSLIDQARVKNQALPAVRNEQDSRLGKLRTQSLPPSQASTPTFSKNFGAILIRDVRHGYLADYGLRVSLVNQASNKSKTSLKVKGETLLFIPPGRYEMKAALNFNPLCGTDSSSMIELHPMSLVIIYFTRGKGLVCEIYPKLERTESYVLNPRVAEASAQSIYVATDDLAYKKPEILTRDQIVSLQQDLQGQLARLLQPTAKVAFNDLVPRALELNKDLKAELAAKERIRIEGDLSKEDLICKKRGFRPSTKEYEACYQDALKRRQDAERKKAEADEKVRQQSEKAAELLRRKADREANDPFADAKARCAAIGLRPKTEAFGKCVLEITR